MRSYLASAVAAGVARVECLGARKIDMVDMTDKQRSDVCFVWIRHSGLQATQGDANHAMDVIDWLDRLEAPIDVGNCSESVWGMW